MHASLKAAQAMSSFDTELLGAECIISATVHISISHLP